MIKQYEDHKKVLLSLKNNSPTFAEYEKSLKNM
jgi:hypothetical protein